MFCCALLCVYSSFAIILMVKREVVALLCLSSGWLMIVLWLFLTIPWVRLQFVIVFFLIIFTCFFKCLIKFFNHLTKEKTAGCFTLIVLFLLCGCYRSLSLPCGAVGLSVVCDCAIFWSYFFTF